MAATLKGWGYSETDPYIIKNADDLDAVRSYCGPYKYYRLDADINLDVAPYNEGRGWQPISMFTGHFNGNGHVIKNLMINDHSLKDAGLFADMSKDSVVTDLGIVHANIKAREEAGILAGHIANNDIQITRCYTTGNISAQSRVGGFIGSIALQNGIKIETCHSNATLSVENDYCGGIIGYCTGLQSENENKNTIVESYFNGTVNGGNLITTGVLVGKAAFFEYKDCFYDKDKVAPHKCEEEGVTALSSKQLADKESTLVYQYKYFKNRAKWRYLKGYAPKLWYEDTEKIFVHFNDAYHIYDKTAEEWKAISAEMPKSLDEIVLGMDNFKDIPIAKFKELESFGHVEVFCYIPGLDEGENAKREIEAVCDTERNENLVQLSTFKETTNKTDEKRALRLTVDSSKDNSVENITVVHENEAPARTDKLTKFDNLINAKTIFIESDKKSLADIRKKQVAVKELKVIKRDATNPYLGLYNPNEKIEVQAFGSAEKAYSGLNLEIKNDYEKNMSADDFDKKVGLIGEKKLLMEKDSKVTPEDINANLSYVFYNAVDTRDRALTISAKSVTKARYLLSATNGNQWLTYDATDGKWKNVDISTVHDAGLTKEQLADPHIWANFPSTYQSRLKTAIGIRAGGKGKFSVQSMNIAFVPNQGPRIENEVVRVTDNKVIFSGIINDLEGDDVEYQVLTQQFGEDTWRQITPEQSGWFKRANGYHFDHSYELSTFHCGDNTIRIVAKDSRGETTMKDYQIIIVSGEPVISIDSHNEFYMKATINHTLGKKIRFMVLINDKQVSPRRGYTDWKEGPFTFEYTWNSDDIVNGLPNKISVIAIDELGTKAAANFNVMGGYKGLLFRDENNTYYSTDKGDILQQLDFGTVVGGRLTEPRIVYLENRTGIELENITVFIDPAQQESKLKLRLSEIEKPFTPVEAFTYSGTMKHGDIKAFYARIETDINMSSIKDKVFHIYAKGDPVIV